MWKKSYPPVAADHKFPAFLLWDSIYLATDGSLWLPLLCGSDPLASGDPVKILLISSLHSLSLSSLLTSFCSSKGATHFLNQRTPLVGMDTPFPCPSLKGRYQALPAAQGLGTCILPQQL